MVKIEIVPDIKEKMKESWDYVDKVLKGKVKIDKKRAEKTIIVTPYLRLDKDKKGREIPEDVRLMLEPRRKPADFVGIQIQVAINNGANGAVPYMYAVFLGKGKNNSFRALEKMNYGNYIKEPGGDEEYGYIVIRQKTGGGGYHTTTGNCINLYNTVKAKLFNMLYKL